MRTFRRGIPKSFLLILLSVFFIVAGGSGCALWKKKEPEKTPEGMYNESLRLLSLKKYPQAAEGFKRFKEEFPLSPNTPLAELRTADALYLDKNYAEAIVLYEEFKKLHPVHPEVPYVIYQEGMCQFNQMLTVDRDQTVTEKALEQFRYLIANFPQNKYVPDAGTKMQLCLRHLAENEFYIGHFYFRKRHYKGALGRFEDILKKYPDSGLEGKINPLIKTCREKIAQEEKKAKEKEGREKKKQSSD
jgi:outer membrane protein assembly factor BamD